MRPPSAGGHAVGGAGAAVAAPPAQTVPSAQPAPPGQSGQPAIEITEAIDLTEDRTQRMTVPVSIDGRGPYGFIVDTGAERTVISRELAETLGLGPGDSATLFSMTEASHIQTVLIPELEVGRRTVSDIHAPALERRHLGAEGLLGVDSLQIPAGDPRFRAPGDDRHARRAASKGGGRPTRSP